MQYDPVYDDRFDGRTAVANSPAAAKALFVQRTYGHLFGAILAFAGIEAALFASGAAEGLVKVFFSLPFAQLLLIGAVIGGGFVAQMLADSSRSKPMQYLGLGLYVLLEVAIFLPILYVAELRFPGQHLPAQAGIVTLLVFGALTTAVFLSGKDFSFMGPFLAVAGFAAMGVILGGWLFGFHLGLLFSAAMIVLGRRVHRVRHVERDAPVRQHPVRPGRAGAVRVGGDAVLLHPAHLHEQRPVEQLATAAGNKCPAPGVE